MTHLGYDVWSDQIWVNYNGRVRGAQGDQLTIYGGATHRRRASVLLKFAIEQATLRRD